MPLLDVGPQNDRSPGELTFGVELDRVPPFSLLSDGKMSWGDGSNARDVSLERSAPGVLNVTGTLEVNGVPVGSGGGVSSVDTGFITSGDFSADSSAFFAVGTALTIDAAVGDLLVLTIEALVNNVGADLQFEAATRVAAANQNFWSSGNGTSRYPGGLPSWYVPAGYNGPRAAPGYRVQANDVVAAQVTVQGYVRSTDTARTVFRNANYPIRVRLDNFGQ